MRFVIFDIDGTLTDTKKVDDKCFFRAFEMTFGINIESTKWESLENVTDWGITEEIILTKLGRKPHKQEYELMIANFLKELNFEKEKDHSQFSEVSGAKAFFDSLLKMDKIELGIATGSWEKSAMMKLDSISVDIGSICFSNSNHHKSREDITKDVINQLQIKTDSKPDKIIYFGDGEWDFNTCQKLGVDFIGIDIEENGKLEKLGAKTILRDFSNPNEIYTWLLAKFQIPERTIDKKY